MSNLDFVIEAPIENSMNLGLFDTIYQLVENNNQRMKLPEDVRDLRPSLEILTKIFRYMNDRGQNITYQLGCGGSHIWIHKAINGKICPERWAIIWHV